LIHPLVSLFPHPPLPSICFSFRAPHQINLIFEAPNKTHTLVVPSTE
jgi:hypothetical protein